MANGARLPSDLEEPMAAHDLLVQALPLPVHGTESSPILNPQGFIDKDTVIKELKGSTVLLALSPGM